MGACIGLLVSWHASNKLYIACLTRPFASGLSSLCVMLFHQMVLQRNWYSMKMVLYLHEEISPPVPCPPTESYFGHRPAILEVLLRVLQRPGAAAAESGGAAKSGNTAKTGASIHALSRLHALLSAHGDVQLRHLAFMVLMRLGGLAPTLFREEEEFANAGECTSKVPCNCPSAAFCSTIRCRLVFAFPLFELSQLHQSPLRSISFARSQGAHEAQRHRFPTTLQLRALE